MKKKKFSIPKRGLRSGPKIAKTTILAMSERNFFFRKKKLFVVFFGVKFTENYYDVAIFIIISRLQSKVEQTKFFIVFSTFNRDPEIIMK